MFDITNCKYSIPYQQNSFTGRCVLSSSLFLHSKHNLTIGCIVKIKLYNNTTNQIFGVIICTAWPDSIHSDLPDDAIVVDDTVIISGAIADVMWTDCKGEIIEVSQPRLCTSLQMQLAADKNTTKQSSPYKSGYSGLPLVEGCIIQSCKSKKVDCSMVIKRLQPSGPCIVTPLSLIAFASNNINSNGNDNSQTNHGQNLLTTTASNDMTKQVNNNSNTATDTSSTTTNNKYHNTNNNITQPSIVSVNTRLVEELIHRVVKPNLVLPTHQQTHGLLLLGPPGCGKSHSAKAVQFHCREWCRVNIVEVSIPEILSSENPIQLLDSIFKQAMKRTVHATSTTTDVINGKSGDGKSGSSKSINDNSLQQSFSSTSSSSSSTSSSLSTTKAVKTPIIYTPQKQTKLQASTLAVGDRTNNVTQTPANDDINIVNNGNTPTLNSTATISTTTSTLIDNITLVTERCHETPINNNNSKSKSNTAATINDNNGSNKTPYSFSHFLQKSTPSMTPKTGVSGSKLVKPRTTTSTHLNQYQNNNNNNNNNKSYIHTQNQLQSHPAEMSLIVIDEIDALGKQGNQSETQVAVISYLCDWFDNQNTYVPTIAKTTSYRNSSSTNGYSSSQAAYSQSRDNNSNSSNHSSNNNNNKSQQLLSSIFSRSQSSHSHSSPLLSLPVQSTIVIPCCVLATTNRPEDVDQRLRRGGRLEKEVEVVTSRRDRVHMLHHFLSLAVLQHSSEGSKNSSDVVMVNNNNNNNNNSSIENSRSTNTTCSTGSNNDNISIIPPLQPLFLSADISVVVESVVDRLGGYVAADIAALVRETSVLMLLQTTTSEKEYNSINRFSNGSSSGSNLTASNPSSSSSSSSSFVSQQQQLLHHCLQQAMLSIPPSSLRGISISTPNLSFSDVIGYETIKKHLVRILSFSDPKKRKNITRFGLSFPGGVILYGPPGNSKTRLILSAASVYGLPVISLSAADVYSPYVGEAEAEIRKAFRLARQSAPCILFLDEIDALVMNRGSGGDGNNSSSGDNASAESRVLATLLTEMDGILSTKSNSSGNSSGSNSDNNTKGNRINGKSINNNSNSSKENNGNSSICHSHRNVDNNNDNDEEEDAADNVAENVFVFGTTNRLESIDAALLRKGRFHQVLHVPHPDATERVALVQYFGHKYSLSEDIIAKLCRQVNSNTTNSSSSDNDNNSSRSADYDGANIIKKNNEVVDTTVTLDGDTHISSSSSQPLLSGAEIENICREQGMDLIRQLISSSDIR